MAGDGRGDVIELVAKAHRSAKLGDLGCEVREQSSSIGLAQRCRNSANEHRRRPEPFDIQSHAGQLGRGALQAIAIRLVEVDHFRHQQGLARDGASFPRRAHALQDQPLMRGMLVNDYEPVFGLCDDVGGGDLPPRDAKGEGRHGLDGRLRPRLWDEGHRLEETLLLTQAREPET